jgi:hypothetical protein
MPLSKNRPELGMVVQSCSPSTWENEAGGSWVQGQTGLHCEFNYIVRPYLKNKQTGKKKTRSGHLPYEKRVWPAMCRLAPMKRLYPNAFHCRFWACSPSPPVSCSGTCYTQGEEGTLRFPCYLTHSGMLTGSWATPWIQLLPTHRRALYLKQSE